MSAGLTHAGLRSTLSSSIKSGATGTGERESSSAPNSWAASIRRRWNFTSTNCRIRAPARGASPLPATTSSGILTIRGYLGRLDTATGKVTEWPSPSGPKSEPCGISAISDVIWYSESGSTPNTVVRFDPKTEKFQSWAFPGGGNIVRNTAVTRDGDFLLADSLVNGLTLVTIEK